MEPPGRGTKIYINSPGHMIKMAVTPIYDKIFKTILIQNYRNDPKFSDKQV